MAKRITKKQIYASFGIQYNGKHIFCDPLNVWMRPVLKNGKGSKIGNGVYQLSLTAGNEKTDLNIALKVVANIENFIPDPEKLMADCGGTCGCRCEHCYALTGFYTFPSTKFCLARHSWIVKNALEWMYRAIMAQIAADKITMVRIHVSGDMVNVEYCDMWTKIAAAYPNTIFWTYTKQYCKSAAMAAALDRFNAMPNCNIVPSIVNGKLNFGECEFIIKLYNELKKKGNNVWICRCGIDKNQHCNDCSHCYKSDYVLFLKHSDGKYNPLNDPYYPDFVKLVESQKNED